MKHSIDVDVRVNDKTVRLYPHRNRLFLEAKNGSEYTIKIRNNEYTRVLAVVTVDGINVINEQAGGASKAGYIINGWSSVEIKGFRTSNDHVNAFKFSTKSKSYAAKSEQTKGDTTNCGVIGVQIFAEKEKPTPPIRIIERIIEKEPYRPPFKPYVWPVVDPEPFHPWKVTYTSNTLGDTGGAQLRGNCGSRGLGASNSIQNATLFNSCSDLGTLTVSDWASSERETTKGAFDMGTEFSNKEINDSVTEVEFETGELLTTFTIYYASKEALLDMGVPIKKENNISFPQAFPSKFCKPPKN